MTDDLFATEKIPAEKIPTKVEERRDAARRYMQRYRSDAGERNFNSFPEPFDPARREACKDDLLLFCKSYYPDTFWRDWSDLHRRFMQRVQSIILDGGQYAIAIPRGFGKTTLLIAAMEWALLYAHKDYALLISKSAQSAKENLSKFEAHFRTNDILAADFPEMCLPIRAIGKQRQGALHVTYKNNPIGMIWSGDMRRLPMLDHSTAGGAIMASTGITGSIKGRNSIGRHGKETRPDLVLIDDPQNAEDALSQVAIKKILRIINGDVMGLDTAGAPLSVFCAVTVAAPEDVGDTLCDRDKSPSWLSERVPAVIKWPTDAAKLHWQTYLRLAEEDLHAYARTDLPSARDYYRAHRSEMDDGAVVADPSFYNDGQESALQWAYEKMWRMGDFEFYCEYQQQPPQTALAETKLSEEQVLAKCRGDLWTVPDWAEFLVVGADLNPKTRGIVWACWAWSRALRGHLVDVGSYPESGVIYEQGVTQLSYQDAIAQAIRLWTLDMRARTYTRSDGSIVPINGLCLDASHEWITVTETCKMLATNLVPIRGRSNRNYKRPSASELRTNTGLCIDYDVARFDFRAMSGDRSIHVNADRVKLHILQSLLAPSDAISALTIGAGEKSKTARMIAEELTSESLYRMTPDAQRGDLYEWVKNPAKNNELLDCTVYSLAGALYSGARYMQAPAFIDAGTDVTPLPQITPVYHNAPAGDQKSNSKPIDYSIVVPQS